jgi:hypothetical protein
MNYYPGGAGEVFTTLRPCNSVRSESMRHTTRGLTTACGRCAISNSFIIGGLCALLMPPNQGASLIEPVAGRAL